MCSYFLSCDKYIFLEVDYIIDNFLIKIKYFNVKSVLGTVISLVGDSYKSVCEKFMIFYFFWLRSKKKKTISKETLAYAWAHVLWPLQIKY
jgi:hypothetical protein